METQSTATKQIRAKIMYLNETAVTAGVQALDELENMPINEKVVRPTAHAVIKMWIHRIVELERKGHDLIMIYGHMKKKMKLRLNFQTFRSYVCSASKEAGLTRRVSKPRVRKEKNSSSVPELSPKSKAILAAQPSPEPEPAPVTTQEVPDEVVSAELAEIAGQTSQPESWRSAGWACPSCEKQAEPWENKEKSWWKCPACETIYADAAGKITTTILRPGRPG